MYSHLLVKTTFNELNCDSTTILSMLQEESYPKETYEARPKGRVLGKK